MRKTEFFVGEYYHIFNRGVDKRRVFTDRQDLERFFQSMREFNVDEPIGSIWENSCNKRILESTNPNFGSLASKKQKLVNFACYCLNPNHYHFLITPLVDDGVGKFMHRIGTGYTKYFNEKYDRSGSLFEGPFKAIHINSNEYLLHLSAYINLNDKIHNFGSLASKVIKSSWGEYSEEGIGSDGEDFCDKSIILEQFGSKKEYVKFAIEAADFAKENKDMAKLLLE
jgi:hypothetical protein